MKRFRSLLLVFTFAALSITAVYVGSQITEDQSSEDSSAIVGGRIETGYPAAGYMLSNKGDNLFDYCGLVNVNPGTVITAAHCLDDTRGISLGFADFTAEANDQYPVTRLYRNTGWEVKDVRKDFAVLEYEVDQSSLESVASIGTPREGCDYRVVGYGRESTNENQSLESRPRKSARVCIDEVDARVFYLVGDTGGICFGDSGSPVFREDTNTVIGVISSIVSERGSTDPCFVGNRAVAVRADVSYNEYISTVQENVNTDSEFAVEDFVLTAGESNTFVISGEGNFLTSFEDLSIEGNEQNLVLAAGGLLIIISFGVVVSQVLKQ